MSAVVLALDGLADRRDSARFPVALPATLKLGDQRFGVKLVNIAVGGAMLESETASSLLNSDVTLLCGTVAVEAAVAWRRGSCIGLVFKVALPCTQISEQVARSVALASRRDLQSQDRPREAAPCGPPKNPG